MIETQKIELEAKKGESYTVILTKFPVDGAVATIGASLLNLCKCVRLGRDGKGS